MPSDLGKPTGLAGLLDTLAFDANVAHLTRVLATASGIDSTLMMVGYTLSFTSTQLRKLHDISVRNTAEKLAETASRNLAPGETIVATAPLPTAATRLAEAAAGMKAFSGMCSETRFVLRLFGLIKMWVAIKATLASPPRDTLIKGLTYFKLASVTAYYLLENQYFLASKGVLRGWKPEEIGRAFKASIWIYGAYILADYISMHRVAKIEKAAGVNEKLSREERVAKEAVWWRTFWIDFVYTPLTFHWGIDGGVLNDDTVGLLGAWGGYTGFREAWRLTK